jgi:hypothetical protein
VAVITLIFDSIHKPQNVLMSAEKDISPNERLSNNSGREWV